jgi:hypothetical protein
MKVMIVKTGFGYFTDAAGHAIAYARLPAGDHPCRDEFEYIEVAGQTELDRVPLWVHPAEQLKIEQNALIMAKQRQLAVAALVSEGKLPADYKG